MGLVTLASNGDPSEVVAAGGKGVVQCMSGACVLENAVDPTGGISLTQGEALAVDGWTAAWNAQTSITDRACVLRVANE